MKSKLILIVSVVAALVVGFFAGRYQMGRAWNSSFEWFAYTDASNQAHFWIRALTYLRDGQQDKAAEFMEGRLDGSLLTFITYEQLPPEQWNEAGLRAIQDAQDYRSKHPWQSSTPGIRDGVQRVLALSK
jgi:hypothetical protein